MGSRLCLGNGSFGGLPTIKADALRIAVSRKPNKSEYKNYDLSVFEPDRDLATRHCRVFYLNVVQK